MSKFSEVFSQARTESGFSQVELAKALGLTSAQYISNCERGLCPMAPKYFRRIAEIFKRPGLYEKFIRAAVTDAREQIIASAELGA